MGKILVAGSYNASMTVVSSRLPAPGQTVLGTEFFTSPGGKGSNQAIGAARLGADVAFAVRLGEDRAGADARRLFEEEGLAGPAVLNTSGQATGVALIVVDSLATNQIAVAPGANSLLTIHDIPSCLLTEVDVLLCQLESPVELFVDLARATRRQGSVAILNPAPATALTDECLGLVDFLTPNETELAEITGQPANTREELGAAAAALLERGVRNVVATLGEQGAMWADRNGVRYFPSREVAAIDTTGAGDAFNAGFAVGLARGLGVPESIELAIACGAYCVTKRGVLAGLPRASDLLALGA